MSVKREWAMPNSNTFSIKPIKQFIDTQLKMNLIKSSDEKKWLDPFARNSKLKIERLNITTNDINPQTDADMHMDALDFLKTFEDGSIDGILFDPPYSLRQVKECYDSEGKMFTQHMSRYFFSDLKNEIARIVKVDGMVLSFGWSSNGIGSTRGFQIRNILMVAHGGAHNDTICVSEIKNHTQLKF